MTAQEALHEVNRLDTELTFLAQCWKDEPDKAAFKNYETKIRKLFPRVLVETVTQRPFGFILRAEDKRLQVKYMLRGTSVTRIAAFSETSRAARRREARK